MNNNFRTDFALDKDIKFTNTKQYTKNKIKVIQNRLNKEIHHIILFNNFSNFGNKQYSLSLNITFSPYF